jgi:uncharacterized protein
MGSLKITRVVIDTNVVISALLFGGAPGKIITLWKEGKIQPLISEDILNEYLKVLAYPRFKLTEKEINFIIYHEILPYFKETVVKIQKQVIKEDPSDDKFIACAEAGKASFIISGDNHLLNLKVYGSIDILPPSQLLLKLKF